MPSMFPDAFAFRIVFPISTVPPQTPPQIAAELPLTKGVSASAIGNLHPGAGDAAARTSSRVAADRAVDDGPARIATRDAATETGRRVAANSAVDECDARRGFEYGPLIMPPPSNALSCRVATQCAIEDRQKTGDSTRPVPSYH